MQTRIVSIERRPAGFYTPEAKIGGQEISRRTVVPLPFGKKRKLSFRHIVAAVAHLVAASGQHGGRTGVGREWRAFRSEQIGKHAFLLVHTLRSFRGGLAFGGDDDRGAKRARTESKSRSTKIVCVIAFRGHCALFHSWKKVSSVESNKDKSRKKVFG